MKKLLEIRTYLHENLGLHYNDNQEKELYKKLSVASKGFNFDDTDNFIDWIITQKLSKNKIEKLASFLTIGETYFFREKKTLDYLEKVYLPELIKKRTGINQKLKIWIAGCSSGEEPYTLAIILSRIVPDIERWDIKIMATDINPSFIKKAKAGIYTKWSFRGLSESIKSRYFEKLDKGQYRINESIRKMVNFSFINIATDLYPAPNNKTENVDVILCRNVLIYFSAKGIEKVTSKFYKSLVEKGVLVVSLVEVSTLICNKFNAISYNGATIYKKEKRTATVRDIEIKSTKLPANIDNLSKLDSKLPQYKKTALKKIQEPELVESVSIVTQKQATVIKIKEQIVIPSYKEIFILFKNGRFEEVEKHIENVLNSNRIEKTAYIILLAQIKVNTGNNEIAEKLCLDAIKLDKINIEAHYLLATIYSEQERMSDAIKSLQKTLFLDPNFVLGHFLLANIYLNNGDKSVSCKHFENAIKSLKKYNKNEIINEFDGLTVQNLTKMIESMKC